MLQITVSKRLRTSIMCTADVSLYTFHWQDPKAAKPGAKSNAERKCVNWSGVEDWARSRAVEKDPWLVLPDGEVVKVRM